MATWRPPDGLWLCTEGLWTDGVGGDIRVSKGKERRAPYEYRARLNPKSKVLFLDGENEEQISNFISDFGKESFDGAWMSELSKDERKNIESRVALGEIETKKEINWPLVAQKWDAIVISPVVDYDVTLSLFEKDSNQGMVATDLRSWDVGSGCLWNSAAISSFKETRSPNTAAHHAVPTRSTLTRRSPLRTRGYIPK